VEVYQNCNVFNDGAFAYAEAKESRAGTTLTLEHGKPLVYGKQRDKGIRLNGTTPEIVELGKGITEDDLLFHDERTAEPTLAYLLSRMRQPEFPEPIGVFRAVQKPCYEDLVNDQMTRAIAQKGQGDLNKLYDSEDAFLV
jgi:2-oxoglutarate ferredoxin oxidoreductase subunit beta